MADPRLEAARVAARDRYRAEVARGVPPREAADRTANRFSDEIGEFAGDLDAEYEQMYAELLEAARKAAPARQAESTDRRPEPTPRQPRPGLPTELFKSPFRFVALNEAVVSPEASVRTGGLDRPLQGGFCGSLDVEWVAETPLLIGTPQFEQRQGAPEPVEFAGPMRLGQNGPWVIPGSTIRGCLRAALEIVASGRLGQINAHHRYGLRDFDHPRMRAIVNHKEVSLLARDRVHAGWLRVAQQHGKTDSDYEIVPCADWQTIAIADLPFRQGSDEYQWRHEWLKTKLDERYRLAGSPIEGGAVCFDRAPRLEFAKRAPGSVGELTQQAGGGIFGTLVFSNKSPAAPSAEDIAKMERDKKPGQPKKREYVFIDHAPADQQAFPVPQDAWDRFELINSKPARARRVPDGSWRALKPSLERAAGRIPVFYTRVPGPNGTSVLEFGLTRFFKIAHEHSVGTLRDRTPGHKRDRVRDAADFPLDFVELLFGYVYELSDVFLPEVLDAGGTTRPSDVARKGRIACGFARLQNPDDAEPGPLHTTVMSAPRASFAPFYLQGQEKDYSASGTTLAGRKRYFPRFRPGQLATAKQDIASGLNVSRIVPIDGVAVTLFNELPTSASRWL